MDVNVYAYKYIYYIYIYTHACNNSLSLSDGEYDDSAIPFNEHI